MQSNQVYCGSDLKPRDLIYPYDTNTAVVIPSVSLVPGRIDAFYFRLVPQTADVSAQLLVWSRASTDSYNFTLVYLKDVTIPRGNGQPYTKVFHAALICNHVQSFSIICSHCHLQSLAIICNHLQSFSIFCNHLQSFAIICNHLQSFESSLKPAIILEHALNL